MGKRLPLAVLFQNATIERLASVLRGQLESGSWSPLLAIQPNGSKLPFFCVHPADGSALGYFELARALGEDQPFYGLQAYGIEEGQVALTSIEQMAETYVSAIRTIQAAGPYLLGGWSLGGVIAFEMARQLQAAGEEVGLLALFDTRRPVVDVDLNYEDVFEEVSTEIVQTLSELLSLPMDELMQMEPGERLTFVLDQALSVAQVFLPDMGSSHELRHRIDFNVLSILAMNRYKPQSYPGRIVYFKATHVDDTSSRFVSEETWDELATEGVEVHSIPASHVDLMSEPQVEIVAKYLKSSIEESLYLPALPN